MAKLIRIESVDHDDETEERLKRGCESFFAMRGAALVLPHSKDSQRPIKKHPGLALSLSCPSSSSSPSSSSATTTITPSSPSPTPADRLNTTTTDGAPSLVAPGVRRALVVATPPPGLDMVPGGPPLPPALVGELQTHLQCIFWILRQEDTIKMAVRLESPQETAIRYMVLVSCLDTHQHTEETIILGVDILDEKASVGLVLPIWADTQIQMGGDGGFTVTTGEHVHIFKPVSIQAMWSALQALYRACDMARTHNYFQGGLHMTWIGYYQSNITSPFFCLKEWDYLPDIDSPQSDEINYFYQREGRYCPTEDELIRRFIFVKLKEIMINSDLEQVTSRQLRNALEQEIGKELKEYNKFIDKQILLIYGQLDSASKIFDHIYLGSEWNASDLDELEENGVGYILNITKECDNFFPDLFQYYNIRLYDIEMEDLLKHWDSTYRFLSKVKEAGSKALVHCKMGISRSASTVIAYAMKEYEMTLDEALAHVQSKRAVIRPNKSFMKQLQVYEGILEASRKRRTVFRSKSESSLSRSGSAEGLHLERSADTGSPEEVTSPRGLPRNKSWCVRDPQSPELGSPQGAVGGPAFYIGADRMHLGAGEAPGSEGESSDDDCLNIEIPVPSVIRPSSIVKLQKEGTLASGDVPFLVVSEHSLSVAATPPTTAETKASTTTVLSAAEDPVCSVESLEGSSLEDTVLNTNNNSANELSLDGSDEGSFEHYQRISVKSKVTEIESSAMGAVDLGREDGEGEEEAEAVPYRRESIPWNPGTVLRQKQEFEEKIRDGSPTASDVTKLGAEEGQTEEEEESSCQEASNVDELVSSVTGSTATKSKDSSGISSEPLEAITDSEVHGKPSGGECAKHKKEDVCSVEMSNETYAQRDVDKTSDSNCRSSVYTTSGEEILHPAGLVERHKREFELKEAATAAPAAETESGNDATAEPMPFTQNAVEELRKSRERGKKSGDEQEGDSDSDNSQTAYPEEGIEWKVGDVRRHTMELEEKLELTSMSPPKRVGRGEDQPRLTDEELRNIRDLESVSLTLQRLEHDVRDGQEEEEEEEESTGFGGVAEQIKKIELKRSASIAKMSNEKVRYKAIREGNRSPKLPEASASAAGAAARQTEPVEEASAAGSNASEPTEDEPLVTLNPDIVSRFTSRLGGGEVLVESSGAGATMASKAPSKRTSKSESDTDPMRRRSAAGASAAPATVSRVKHQHGPSHPLNKLGVGRGAVGRGAGKGGGSTRGKFYSTM